MSSLSFQRAIGPIALVSILLHFCHRTMHALATTGPLAPALFAFGDSIVDPGNNNGLTTVIKANFPPYGIDFAGHQPTGRFCNGLIPTDIIASKLRIKELLPPYAGTELAPEDLMTGVSFASGGSGFDPLTSRVPAVISMDQQLQMFTEYKEKLKALVGEERAASIVSKGIYVVCAGSDDLANNYFFLPFRNASYDIPAYSSLLMRFASNFLKGLIDLGARKIAILGIPPIGCVPSQRTLGGGISRDCAPGRNQLATLFNSKIALEARRITAKYHGTNLVYVDIYNPLFDIIQHPKNYGFSTSARGCCGTGVLEVAVLCNGVTSSVCPDVSKHVFWDSYHPTEEAYKIIVDTAYNKYIGHLLKDL